MGSPELTPLQKYEQYVATHKAQCKGLSITQICSIMVKNKILTTVELADLKNNPILFPQNKFGKEKIGYENFGLFLSDTPQPVKNTKVPYAIQYTHPMIAGVLCDEKKNIDLSQFSLKSLKEKYNSKEYNVTQDKNGAITVKTKNNEDVLFVRKNFINETVVSINRGGGKAQNFTIKKDGTLEDLTNIEEKNGKTISQIYRKGSKIPEKEFITYPDGSHKQTNFDKNGKVEFEDYWKKGGYRAEWVKQYSNGILWSQRIGNNKQEYPLVTEIYKDINAKTVIGSPTTRSSLQRNIISGINYQNIRDIWDEYEKRYGKNPVDALRSRYNVDTKVKKQCITHMEKLYCAQAPAEKAGEYLAERLYNDIHGNDKSELAEHVKMINKRNLKYTLVAYREKSFYAHHDKIRDINITMNTIEQYLPKFITNKIRNYESSKITPYQGLLEAIAQTPNMSNKAKSKLITQIVNTGMEEENEFFVKQTKKEIAKHPSDMHKIEIDLYALENRAEDIGDLRNPELKTGVKAKVNDEFDGPIKQDRTGDCWLLAGVNSILAKPELRKEFTKLITYDDKTKTYTVNLKGAGKVYKISKNEVDNTPNLAKGSKKINALEIAMDRLIREQAYNDKTNYPMIDSEFGYIHSVTIDGNWTSTLYRALGFKEEYDFTEINPLTAELNDGHTLFNAEFGGREREIITGLATCKKDEHLADLHTRHAYSIIGSDKNNIYLTNPWDSSAVITMTRENFKKAGGHIRRYKVNLS